MEMEVTVHFYSYFKDLAGCAQVVIALGEGRTVADLLRVVGGRFPKWAAADRATLIAIGVEYASREQVLKAGDEISLFPPVQGG